MIAKRMSAVYFDLENPFDRSKMQNPMMTLESLRGLVILDEIQTLPELFPVLRVLADRLPLPAKFLLLGSSSPAMIQESSESPAGRVEFIDIAPFTLSEINLKKWKDLWVRGGYPLSFLAADDDASTAWRQSYLRSFFERDAPHAGNSLPADALVRLWSMIAHYHGQRVNFSDIGRSIGLTDNTIRRYLDTFSGMYLLRQLQPWFENISKRQVKAPKIYLRDSGLLHFLYGVRNYNELLSYPRCGASWEGFALE